MSRHQLHPEHAPSAGASPVVAVLVMTAVAVLMAAGVYIATTGFTSTQDQVPGATFGLAACDPSRDLVALKLTSRGPVEKDEVTLVLFNRTDDTREATADPLDPAGGPWSTGAQVEVEAHTEPEPSWDAALDSPGGLEAGTRYKVDFVHGPTETVFSTRPFTC